MDSPHTDIARGLLSRYSQESPATEQLQILDCERISDGWETEVYAFAVERGVKTVERTREDLILRIYPGDGAAQTATHEFNVMKQVLAAGFPVPRVLLLELDAEYVGGPFIVMERINGRSMGATADEGSVEQRQELLTQFIRLMVDLHRLDWRPFVDDASIAAGGDAALIVRDELSQWQAMAHSLPMHAFDPAFDWLQARIGTIRFGQPSLIHMDYHPFNLLLREDGQAVVIDWTSAQVSDYRLDLAWTLLLKASFGHPEEREFLLGEYERSAGHAVEQIEFFEVAASVRRLGSILISLEVGAETMGMRAGAEAMMANVPHITSVYDFFRDRAGLRIPEIETLLSNLS